jgi:hypothetical protein
MDQNDLGKHAYFGLSLAAAAELLRANAMRPDHWLGRVRDFALEFGGAFLVSVVYDYVKRLFATKRRNDDPTSEKGIRRFNPKSAALPSVGPSYGDPDVVDILRPSEQQAQIQRRVPKPKASHAEDAMDRDSSLRSRGE